MLEVLDGSPVGEFALRYGVSRQSVHAWKRKYLAGGIEALREVSRRPRTSPTRVESALEALVCEMRRTHPRWGARRITFELGQSGVVSPPSRATVHRILVRNGLVRAQPRQHRASTVNWCGTLFHVTSGSTVRATSRWDKRRRRTRYRAVPAWQRH